MVANRETGMIPKTSANADRNQRSVGQATPRKEDEMKRHLVGLFVLALSALGTLGAEQKFSSLPIGYNLGSYISSIKVNFGRTGNRITENYSYARGKDVELTEFATAKLRDSISRYAQHEPIRETEWYAWGIYAITDGIGGLLPTYNGESKPATIAVAPLAGEATWFQFTLRNGTWEVPEEVFGKVKFQFGAAPGFYIPGVTDLEVNLFGADGRVSMFSTREQISGLNNPCVLPATLDAIKYEEVIIIPNEIALARTSWWKHAEITLLTPNESVTFRVNRTEKDGVAIRWSDPPPSFFIPPTPKISSLKRKGDKTELAIEGTPNNAVVVEWIEKLGDEWQPLYPPYPESLDANGRGSFIHETAGATGFYRVRSENRVTATKLQKQK